LLALYADSALPFSTTERSTTFLGKVRTMNNMRIN
jgi:hypothetical protein